ncbi:MAG: PLP-dependent aminotransferase family protein [Defluviitaleaceae bacterium]|nr:PLP-dependent aminotransferase family protein [Defluviitaleaceae bacterium]MCL2264380.1 PLP-dependent aminotransferase family protein [Defluviitaleaceae bacterium]
MITAEFPLYRKIGEDILQKISTGEFTPNTRLPAIRTLAKELGVNNTTIVNAYKYLEQKRAVYSVTGSGVYVAGQNEELAPVSVSVDEGHINFAATASDTSLFPKEDFRHAFDAVLSRDGAGAFSSVGFGGYKPLREVISDLLKNSAVSATPEDIHITADLRQGLCAVIDGLAGPKDYVLLESPCAPWITAAFTHRGVKIREFPLTENGADLQRLYALAKKHKPKIIFLSSNYQFPTGLCYTVPVQEKILELSQEINAHIIELDEYGDFFYCEKPTPLKAMDTSGRVVYLKSFERVLAHGLAGYIVGNITLNESADVSAYIQRGLDFYLRNNDYDAFCAKLRGFFSKRYRRAVSAAETFLAPYANFTVPHGGFGLWISPKNATKTAELIDEFLTRKVIVSPGRLYLPSAVKPAAERHFRISFSNASEDDISRGMGIIASVLKGG